MTKRSMSESWIQKKNLSHASIDSEDSLHIQTKIHPDLVLDKNASVESSHDLNLESRQKQGWLVLFLMWLFLGINLLFSLL